MSAQRGKDLLIKIYDGASYTTVAGLRTRRLAFNAETVDITSAESANRWRELLDGAGVKRASSPGAGCSPMRRPTPPCGRRFSPAPWSTTRS